MSQGRKLTVYKAFVNTFSSYPIFSGCSGSFLDKILVTYSFQPDLEDLVQHLRITIPCYAPHWAWTRYIKQQKFTPLNSFGRF